MDEKTDGQVIRRKFVADRVRAFRADVSQLLRDIESDSLTPAELTARHSELCGQWQAMGFSYDRMGPVVAEKPTEPSGDKP